MGAIYRREMNAFFTSGLAYVFLAVFFFMSGMFFYNYTISYASADMSPVFSSMFLVVMILISILTMRLFSEEKKNRTDQGLLTAPVGLWSIVLGKYFAALTLFVLAESIVFIYAFIVGYFGTVIWATFIGNYVAMLLLAAAFIAVGVFFSSLTENQMIAAVVSFVTFLLLYFVDEIANLIPSKFIGLSTDFVKEILISISFYSKYIEFTMGIFNLSSVVFYISAAFIFNFFTVRVLEKRRWS